MYFRVFLYGLITSGLIVGINPTATAQSSPSQQMSQHGSTRVDDVPIETENVSAETVISALRANPQVVDELRQELESEAQRRGLSRDATPANNAELFRYIQQNETFRAQIAQELAARGLIATSEKP